MNKLLLLMLLAPGVSLAGNLYKCVQDGATSYQDSPCNAASKSAPIELGKASTLVGCYVAQFPGWEGGAGTTENFEIRPAGYQEYTLAFTSGARPTVLPMRRATATELREVSAGFHLALREGVVVKVAPGTPNQKPVGIYAGQDGNGKALVLAFLFLSNGLASPVPCH